MLAPTLAWPLCLALLSSPPTEASSPSADSNVATGLDAGLASTLPGSEPGQGLDRAPSRVQDKPWPPQNKGTGMLIAAGALMTASIVGRGVFGLALIDNINTLDRSQALTAYRFGVVFSVPAGAAIALAGGGRALRGRRDLYQDLYIRERGPQSKQPMLIAGASLLGLGMAGWIATRAAAPAVAEQCERGECFVGYMEGSWYGSVALSSAGALLVGYGAHYTRLSRRWKRTGDFVLSPTFSPSGGGLSLSARF